MPESIGLDRELASLYACVDVFPSAYIYLCSKHIRGDIERWLMDKTKDIKDAANKAKSIDTVKQLLGSVMDMFEMKVSEDVYEQHKSTFLGQLASSRSKLSLKFHKYLMKEWIVHDKHIAAAYRLKRRTYGKHTTNCAEALHFSLKHYLKFRSNRLQVFVPSYVRYVEDMHAKFENGKVITTMPCNYFNRPIIYCCYTGQVTGSYKLNTTRDSKCGPIFRHLYGVCSKKVIDEMYDNLVTYCKYYRLHRVGYTNNALNNLCDYHRNNVCDCTNSGYLCPYAMGNLFKTDEVKRQIELNMHSEHCVEEINWTRDVEAIATDDIDIKWKLIVSQPYNSVNIARKCNADRRNEIEERHKRVLTEHTGEQFNSKRKLRGVDHAQAVTLIKLTEGTSKKKQKR